MNIRKYAVLYKKYAKQNTPYFCRIPMNYDVYTQYGDFGPPYSKIAYSYCPSLDHGPECYNSGLPTRFLWIGCDRVLSQPILIIRVLGSELYPTRREYCSNTPHKTFVLYGSVTVLVARNDIIPSRRLGSIPSVDP